MAVVRQVDAVLDEVAATARDLQEKARAMMLASSQYQREADAGRPGLREIAAAWFEAGLHLKREAEELGRLVERHGRGR